MEKNNVIVDAYVTLGKKLWAMDKIDASEECYRNALKISPNHLEAMRRLALFLEKTNQLSEAEKIVCRGLSIYPFDPELNYAAAKIERRLKKKQSAISRLSLLKEKQLPLLLLKNIYFELAHLYDEIGDTDRAFIHFTEANLKAAKLAEAKCFDKVHAHNDLTQMNMALKQIKPEDDCKKRSFLWMEGYRHSPIFMVGFPRSGTTLLDLSLDNHPDIQVLSEKPAVNAMMVELKDSSEEFSCSLANLSQEDAKLCQEVYYRTIGRHLVYDSNKQLVDKMPLNIINIPLIIKAFPEAKFVLALRHPCDAVLSCFMQNFRLNDQMANFFSLNDAVTYYTSVMEFWRQCIDVLNPNFIMVKMEDLICNFDREIERLLDFIGVDWNDSVRNYSNTAKKRRRIHTPSYHQVVLPVNQSGVGRWNRYINYLRPYLNTIKPLADYFEYQLELS